MSQEYLEDKAFTLKKLTGSQRLWELCGLAMFVATIYVAIVLISFDKADPSWSQTAWHQPIHNVGGYFGAWIADILFSTFGFVAYLLLVISFYCCWHIFKYRSTLHPLNYFTLTLKIIGALLLVLSSCALADIHFDDWYDIHSGGLLGNLFNSSMLPNLTIAEITLILLASWALGLTLLTNLSWLTVLEKTGIITLYILAKMVSKWRDYQQYRTHSSFLHTNSLGDDDELIEDEENAEDKDKEEQEEARIEQEVDTANQPASDTKTEPQIKFIPQYPMIDSEPTIKMELPPADLIATNHQAIWGVDAFTHTQAIASNAVSSDINCPTKPQETEDYHLNIVNQRAKSIKSEEAELTTAIKNNDSDEETLAGKNRRINNQTTRTILPVDPMVANTNKSNSHSTIKSPVFTPATKKLAQDMPRPNPVRIPTRRELLAYGIKIPSHDYLRPLDKALAENNKKAKSTMNTPPQNTLETFHDKPWQEQSPRTSLPNESTNNKIKQALVLDHNDKNGEQSPSNNAQTSWLTPTINFQDEGDSAQTATQASMRYTMQTTAIANTVLTDNKASEREPTSTQYTQIKTAFSSTEPNESGKIQAADYANTEQKQKMPLAAGDSLIANDFSFMNGSHKIGRAYANSSTNDNIRATTTVAREQRLPISHDSHIEKNLFANYKESIIHPFLARNDQPINKSTTPLPTLDLLTSPPNTIEPVDMAQLENMARLIEERLADYRVKASVVDSYPGPVITLFELELAPGVKAARISNLSRDLARSLSAVSVRVVEVIPGRPYVGLELPNLHRQTVYLREVLDCDKFREIDSPLAIVLGKDISGNPVVADLAKMPHVLVAGTTGSGKSVGVNAMIISMLYKAKADEVRFIMIDPKMLELSVYEGIPHLLTEVVTDMKDAANALRWCVGEMERRYKLMSALGVRNLASYNERIQIAINMGHPVPDPFWKSTDNGDLNVPLLEKLPYIVVIVDEFADLMMAVGKKVEELIARLAQKARAAGIHLVLATQRPSVDVITGLIKANIPTRIAFTVSSKIDSRTILDQGGAESLLGMGDMLYLAPNSSTPLRIHGAFVRDEEVHAVVQDWKGRGKPNYIDSITETKSDEGENSFGLASSDDLDPLFDQAVNFVIEKRRPSISGVQRQFRIGYNRAARIIEQMELQGIVSPPSSNGNREVLAPPPA